MIPPTIGRIVHVNLNGVRKPAMVTVVHSHAVVDLEVFGIKDPEQRFPERVEYNAEAEDEVASARPNSMINKVGCWAWPPRV